MEYIIRLKKFITEEQRDILCNYGNIVYQSKYLPILGMETKRQWEISLLSFVESIRSSREGEYQSGEYLTTCIFEPSISKRLLINGQMTGWGTKIFVLDSGVDERQVSIQEQKDFTHTGYHDFVGHGTTIAKIIKHFSKGSLIYSAKVGTPKPLETNMLKGIEWAIDKGAHIINISSEFSKKNKCKGNCELCELVDIAASRGIAVVVAAGNSDQAVDSIVCPGIASGSFTVGAVSSDKKGIASYSSVGRPGCNKPNIIAPGQGYVDGEFFSGTSFAAPVVSGVIGAIYNHVGNVAKAFEYICNTTEDLKLPRHYQGLGCLSLEKLLEVVTNEISNIKSSEQIGN